MSGFDEEEPLIGQQGPQEHERAPPPPTPTPAMSVVLNMVACFHVFLTAGVVFGASSLLYVWEQEGVFSSLCDDGETSCTSQTTYLELVYTIGAVANYLSNFPFGFVLDKYGPRKTALVSSVFFLIGVLCCMFYTWYDVLLLPVGFFFLGFAGPGLQMATVQFSNLFPHHRNLVLCINTACFDASTCVFLFLQLMYPTVGFIEFMDFYIIAPIFCFFTALWLWPDRNYEMPGEHEVGDAHFISDTGRPRMPYYNAPVRQQIGTRMYKYIMSFVSIHILRINYICGIMLYQLGYLFGETDGGHLTYIFDWFLPFGFVAIPLGWWATSQSIHMSFNIASLVGMVWGITIFFPIVGVQYVGFAFIAASRQLVYGIKLSNLAVEFGFDNYGKLAGLVNLVVACVSTLQYLFVWITETYLGSDYGIINIGLFAIVLPLLFISPVDREYEEQVAAERARNSQAFEDSDDEGGAYGIRGDHILDVVKDKEMVDPTLEFDAEQTEEWIRQLVAKHTKKHGNSYGSDSDDLSDDPNSFYTGEVA